MKLFAFAPSVVRKRLLASKFVWFVALLLASLASAYVARAYLPSFGVLFMGVFVTLLVTSLVGSRRSNLLYNFSFVALALAAYEFYEAYKDRERRLATELQFSTWDFQTPDRELGWRASSRDRAFKVNVTTAKGTPVFSVTYTFDRLGLRVTPQTKSDKLVYFVGDSLIFGHGVEDFESLPYVFSALDGSQGRNFGQGGYGGSQVLRLLEKGMLRGTDPQPPRYVVYTAIPNHIDRSAGYWPWWEAPFYRVENGRPVFAGQAKDANQSILRVLSWLSRSYLLKAFVTPHVLGQLKQVDTDRYFTIVKRMKEIVESEYDSELILLCWDAYPIKATWYLYAGEPTTSFVNEFCNQLAATGARTIRLSQTVPEVNDASLYLPIDGHPGPRVYEAIAAMLRKELP